MMTDNIAAKVRVVDRHGHALFFFNSETLCIEIKVASRRGGHLSTRREVYSINVEHLLAIVKGNAEPVNIFEAKRMDSDDVEFIQRFTGA